MTRLASLTLAAATFAGFSWPSEAWAEPLRILVAAGHRQGAAGERPLEYARDDAVRVADLFRDIGGVRADTTLFLDEPSPASLRAALERARVLAAGARADEVTFLFYFSGHGDRAALHLGADALAMTELEGAVARIPAALRIVVLDACRTDDNRPKGLAQDAPFTISLGEGTAQGSVWIHAAGEGDPAQESRELGGGVFTHYWLSALRGAADTDGDKRVTLAEAYEYAYHQTLFRSARASGVVQRPTARLDLKEVGPVVLTTPTPRSAKLLLPQAADAQFLVYEPRSRRVLAEAWSASDRRVALALAPGSYVVQRRLGARGGAVDVTLARGETRPLSSDDFRDLPMEALARKGGDVVLRPHEIEVRYAPAVQLDFGLVHRAALAYAYSFGDFAFGAAVHGGLGRDTTASRDVRETTLGAGLAAEWRPALPVDLRLGAGPTVEWVAQQLDRLDAARANDAGLATRETRHAVGAGGFVAPRVVLSLGSTLRVAAGARAAMVFAPATTGTITRTTFGGEVGVGAAF